MIIGFIIWLLFGCAFIVFGISGILSKKDKPTGFWANVESFSVAEENVRAFNRAMGKLWCVFGAVLVLLGLPILWGNTAAIIVTILGTMAEAIIAMGVYMTVIEPKYRKK